jgi:TPR repeat protein
LTLAADQGRKDAQFNLGLAYSNLSEPNYDLAEMHLREASFNGHFPAIFELSKLYSINKKDYAKGLLWIIVALEYCGREDEQRFGKIRKDLESKLSRTEYTEIEAETQ